MTNKELTSLAIRVFAIYVLVQAIILIAQSVYGWNSYFQGVEKWLIIIPISSIVGLITVFYMLWKLSYSVFKGITPLIEKEKEYKVDQIFILQLVGFYLILVSLIDFAQGALSLYYIYFLQASEYGTTYQPEMTSHSLLFIIGSGLKTVISLTLIIKPSNWMKLFNRLRTIGLNNK